NAPASGYLTAPQRDQLLASAAPAVARWDDEQKKLEEDKKKVEEERQRTMAAAPSMPSSSTSTDITRFDGTYTDSLAITGSSGSTNNTNVVVRVTSRDGRGSATVASGTMAGCSFTFPLTVSPTGEVGGEGPGANCSPAVSGTAAQQVRGRIQGN